LKWEGREGIIFVKLYTKGGGIDYEAYEFKIAPTRSI
jgi:hypothetical protein